MDSQPEPTLKFPPQEPSGAASEHRASDQLTSHGAASDLATNDDSVHQVGVLELREELPVVTRERVVSGQLSFRREVQQRTETVSMELTREILVIEVHSGDAAVFLGDEPLKAGETREVVLYDERIEVSKLPYVTEEVRIGKRTITEILEQQIDLKYEALVVDETQGEQVSGPTLGSQPATPGEQ